jgi:hypothetical protein
MPGHLYVDGTGRRPLATVASTGRPKGYRYVEEAASGVAGAIATRAGG